MSSSGSSLKPRSRGGQLFMLLLLLYFLWLAVTQPAEAVETLKAIASVIGDVFEAVFAASQDAGA